MRTPIKNLTREAGKRIHDYTQLGLQFTAHDITSALRTEFPNDEIQHSEVRSIVSSLWQSGYFNEVGYDRHILTNVSGNPYLYMRTN